jgi:hypothetical protein
VLRDGGGTISSRTALHKALRESPAMERADADAAIDYVLQLGWARVGDNGTSIDLVNDPGNPTTSVP